MGDGWAEGQGTSGGGAGAIRGRAVLLPGHPLGGPVAHDACVPWRRGAAKPRGATRTTAQRGRTIGGRVLDSSLPARCNLPLFVLKEGTSYRANICLVRLRSDGVRISEKEFSRSVFWLTTLEVLGRAYGRYASGNEFSVERMLAKTGKSGCVSQIRSKNARVHACPICA